MKNHSVLKILILVIFFLFGAYLFFHFDLYIYFTNRKRAIDFIYSFHPYDAIAFIIFQVLQVVFAPIPGEVTGLIGGYLYGPVLGTLYSTVGLTLGSWLAFALARNFGLPFVERAVKPEIVEKYDYVMEHQGVFISFILFLIPGFPKDYLCYLMGLSHMTTAVFLIISTSGRLLGTIMLSFCGAAARQQRYTAMLVIFGVSGVCLLLAFLYREKLLALLRKKKKT